MAKRVNLTQAQRVKVFIKSHRRCHYCGNPLSLHRMTIDHVIPVSRGGKNKMNNYVASCQDCNQSKSSHSVEAFEEYITNLPDILSTSIQFRLLCKHYKVTIKRKSNFIDKETD